MSDELHRFVSATASAGKKISLIPGRLNKFTILNDAGCAIYFTLKRKKDDSPLGGQAFILTGQGIRLRNTTDTRGTFRYGPVKAGEYELEVEDQKLTIPARSAEESPFELVIDTEAEEKK